MNLPNEIIEKLDIAGCFHSWMPKENKEKALKIIIPILNKQTNRIHELEKALKDSISVFQEKDTKITEERLETWKKILKN